MDGFFWGKVEKTIMKMILLYKYKCTGCKTCEKASSVGHSPGKDAPFLQAGKKIRPENVEVQKEETDIYDFVQWVHDIIWRSYVHQGMYSWRYFIKILGVTLSMIQKKCVGVLDVCRVLPSWHSETGREEKWKAKEVQRMYRQGEKAPRCVEACPKEVLEFVEVWMGTGGR